MNRMMYVLCAVTVKDWCPASKISHDLRQWWVIRVGYYPRPEAEDVFASLADGYLNTTLYEK